MGVTNRSPEYVTTKEVPTYICFGDHTRSFNIAKKSFCVMDNVKVLQPLQKFSVNVLLFITSSWRKNIPDKGYSRHWGVAKKAKIQLPVKKGKIDFEFMETLMSKLETHRVAEIRAYLTKAGLKDYTLTEAEEKAIRDFTNIKWKESKIVDMFDVDSYKKRFDANKVKVLDSGHPYIVRSAVNNGLRGYLDEDPQYLNEGNTISFGQDTATMFYQKKPYFTGDKIKILKAKRDGFDENKALFLIAAMNKSFAEFSWGSSSFSEEVIKNQKINLPEKNDGTIDYEYLTIFITAVKKLLIKDLVKWLDKKG